MSRRHDFISRGDAPRMCIKRNKVINLPPQALLNHKIKKAPGIHVAICTSCVDAHGPSSLSLIFISPLQRDEQEK